jgi:hypothetical protein
MGILGRVWYGGQRLGLKILMEGPDGWYIGGDRPVPTLIAPFSDETYEAIELAGITSTGPGLNDWIVAGDGATILIGGLFAEADAVFYDSTGLIFSERWLDLGEGGLETYAGHFGTFVDNPTVTSTRWRWKSPVSSGGTTTGAGIIGELGYVLAGVLTGDRLQDVGDFVLRQVANLDPDYSHAVFVGDRQAAGPPGNPWLATAAGAFTRLNTDLNTAIPKGDLVDLVLYEKSISFYFGAFTSAGLKTLTITPHAITEGGIVTTGSPFPVQYYEYDPALFSPIDASYHP